MEVASVTRFWNEYIDYQGKHHPKINSVNRKGPKGAKSKWPTFKAVHKDITIVHKTEKGYVDLSFRGGYEKIHMLIEWLEEVLGDLKELGVTVESAGKSAVLRKNLFVLYLNYSLNYSEISDSSAVKICYT